jgi:lysophospholipase L1-like esterase
MTVGGCSTPTAPTPPSLDHAPPSAPPPLSLNCPSNIEVVTSDTSRPVSFGSPSVSGGAPPVEVSCTRQSGSSFAVGPTTVQCTARDAAGQSAACTFQVTVVSVAPRLSLTSFLAFGDSLTSGEISVPVPSLATPFSPPIWRQVVVPQASYPTQLENRLRGRYTVQPTIQMINAGRPGEWAQDGASRFVSVLTASRAEVVLLLHGYNDIGTQLELGIDRASQALDFMVVEARSRGCRVFLATLPPPRLGGTHSLPTSLVTSFNSRVRNIASSRNAVLVDLYGNMLSGVSQYIGLDGLHPTEAGYARMAELFFDAIRTDLEIRPPASPSLQ